jgi:hypothetical protein
MNENIVGALAILGMVITALLMSLGAVMTHYGLIDTCLQLHSVNECSRLFSLWF